MSQTPVVLTEMPWTEADELQSKVRLVRKPFTHTPDHILYFDHQETIDMMIELRLKERQEQLDKNAIH